MLMYAVSRIGQMCSQPGTLNVRGRTKIDMKSLYEKDSMMDARKIDSELILVPIRQNVVEKE